LNGDPLETVGVGLESVTSLQGSSSDFEVQLEDQWVTAAGKTEVQCHKGSSAQGYNMAVPIEGRPARAGNTLAVASIVDGHWGEDSEKVDTLDGAESSTAEAVTIASSGFVDGQTMSWKVGHVPCPS
jgi:hypothetical protein